MSDRQTDPAEPGDALPADERPEAEPVEHDPSEDPPEHRRILQALRDQITDRPDVVFALARTTLRRIPASQLRAAEPVAAARQLLEAFHLLDERRDDELIIRVVRPLVGLDGSPGPGSVVQVASEDRPFLLNTVVDELERLGYRVVRALHPIFGVERDADGRIARIVAARTAEDRESLLHIELDERIPDDRAEEIVSRLRELVADVMAATGDFEPMQERIAEVAAELEEPPPPGVDPEEAAEVAALLRWLLDGNFVLLGVREYRMHRPHSGEPYVQVVPGSGLGLLHEESSSRYADPVPLSSLPAGLQERFLDPALLTVSRTNRLSTVQRRVRMEYVGVTRFDAEGRVCGEFRILGLYTRKGIAEPARTTPVLRVKLARILELEDVVPGSHDEGQLVALFHALPKDELFQADTDTLHRMLVGLFHAEEHREIRTLVRTDHHIRIVSIVVAVPRDAYNAQLRERLQELFLEHYGPARIDVEVSLGERNEALVRFLLHPEGEIPEVSAAALQRAVRELARSWVDDVTGLLVERCGEAEGHRIAGTLVARLPRPYRDMVPALRAVEDVLQIDRLLAEDGELSVVFHAGDAPGSARVQATKRGQPLELSGFLPIIESLGLVAVEEVPHRLVGEGPSIHLHDFGVRDPRGVAVDVTADGARLAEAILAAWRGHLEVDSLNRVVLTARLPWRDVAVLRAYRRYRRQVGTAFTPEYVNDTLAHHPDVARALIAYFHARFDPDLDASEQQRAAARQTVLDRCDEVARLDHDRIARGLLHLMDATLRTNAFREDRLAAGDGTPYLSFKLDPSKVPEAPAPIPHREIFVHSPQVEGVHLRGGRVARGGLRWSDRKDDVRTEVLGLVKAQILKNALIVPTGAKGGFVVKREPDNGDALRDEVRRQYTTFIRGLLDITDNLRGGQVVPPPRVVRHDGDDPYLVVAADRGTATFSDTANDIAASYGFWLGDAFASGGSKGYDHKALGVTARGTWLAVRRHFRELGTDVQSEPITIAGIGDMSGDVFGNGLRQSRAVKLVAAFDHRDIFLDPDPDPEAAYAERQRLYDLPRSTWQDYDPRLLSTGGRIYSRADKALELTDEIRALLRVEARTLTPPELIRAVLTAPVDLLFAGGIGTYIKATEESDEDIGDRANDEVRVNADQVRARVIGEGANLAITQRGRIQYARRGGRINQDAIDNTAGVGTSDHEVNVKILLDLAVEEGRIDRRERDRLLGEVTDEVVAHVLRSVDLQTWCLSQEQVRSPLVTAGYDAFLTRLEERSDLNRDVEVLPSSAELADRTEAGAGLTRPELATLLAWAKRDLKETMLASDLPDEALLQPALRTYFPSLLVERFDDLLFHHRLRRELVATIVANDVVDRMGITFASTLAQETGANLPEVVRAYWVARETVDADRWWRQIEELTGLFPADRQLELKASVDRLVGDLTVTHLDDPGLTDPAALVARDRPVAEALIKEGLTAGTEAQQRTRRQIATRLMDDLVEDDLTRFLACARDLAMVPDVAVATGVLPGRPAPSEVADAFLRLGDVLSVDRLERLLEHTKPGNGWARRQHTGLLGDLRRVRRDAATRALREHADLPEPDAVDAFIRQRVRVLERISRVTRNVEATEPVTLDAIAVAVRTVRDAVDRPL